VKWINVAEDELHYRPIMDMALNPQILQKWRILLTNCTTSTLSSVALLHKSLLMKAQCIDVTSLLQFSFHISILQYKFYVATVLIDTPEFLRVIFLHLAINCNY
jgi:hypothetical protein